MNLLLSNGRGCARPEYTLLVQEVGEDVPVLFLHPAMASFSEFLLHPRGGIPTALAARGCRVVGFDLPGHGQSGQLAEYPEDFLERCVEDAQVVLDTAEIEKAGAVIGIGFGGIVAVELAARIPGRFNCVVADSLPGIVHSVPFEPWGPHFWDPDSVEPHSEFFSAWLRYTEIFRKNRSAINPELRLSRPTLWICGSPSDLQEVRDVYSLARQMGPVQVAWAPSAAPPACFNSPRFFWLEVERFLAAHA